MKGCRVFRLSSVLFAGLALILLGPCEADVIITVCNNLPNFVSPTILVSCGYGQGVQDEKNSKIKLHIHYDACGKQTINVSPQDGDLSCSLYGEKNIPWETPTFLVLGVNPNPSSRDMKNDYFDNGVRNEKQEKKQHPRPEENLHHFSFKQDGVYARTDGKEKLLQHWHWHWPSKFDAYIHNKFKDRTPVSVTCRTGRKRLIRWILRPGKGPMHLVLKIPATVHRSAQCSVYWSGKTNKDGKTYSFYAFDVSRVRDDIYYFSDGLRGVLNWHMKEDGLYEWDDAEKREEKMGPWSQYATQYKTRRKRRSSRRYRSSNLNEYYGENHW